MKNQFLQNKSKRAENKIEDKIKENLLGSKFRILNEKLYTISSQEAYKYFQENPEDFEVYHQGFVIQAKKWPVNPNEIIFRELQKDKYKYKTIADMGCGEAFIAQKLPKRKIHSFDLVKYNQYITQCDIRNVPLPDLECDIVIFCLSLMGTNFIEFIREAHRILKPGGILIIAEILSRIISLDKFLAVFENLNFRLRKQKNIKNYFSLFIFRKEENSQSNNSDLPFEEKEILKPCLYKKR